MSKDSPFVSEYTEYHKLTKGIFHKSLEPQVRRWVQPLLTRVDPGKAQGMLVAVKIYFRTNAGRQL